jgi:hypothetical protein
MHADPAVPGSRASSRAGSRSLIGFASTATRLAPRKVTTAVQILKPNARPSRHELCPRHLITGRVRIIFSAALLNATCLVEDRVPPDRLGSGNGGGTFHISASKGGAPRFPVRAAERTTRGCLVKGNVAEWAAALHHDVMPAGVADVVQGDDPIFGIVPDTVLPFTGGAGVAGKGVIAL